MLEKGLHAGNLTAAFAIFATTADLTFAGGAATFFGAMLSGTAIYKSADREVKKAAKQIANDLDHAIMHSHVTPDQAKLLHQMLAAYPPTDADFAQANMNGATLTADQIDRIKNQKRDNAHFTPKALDVYATIMPDIFQAAIDRERDIWSAVKALLERSEKSGGSERLRDEGITEKAIIRLAQRIVADTDNLGQAWLELQNAMDIAVRVQAEGQVQSNHGDFVDTVLANVAELAKEGDYAGAGATIDEALGVADANISRLLASGFEIALLDRDTAKAASLLFRQADLAAGGSAKFDDLGDFYVSFYDAGKTKGSHLDSQLAIDLARRLVERAQNGPQRHEAKSALGIALGVLGERQKSNALLVEASKVFKNWCDGLDRDQDPIFWAGATMNLGNAYQKLGEREKGFTHLRLAKNLYEDSLEVFQRDTHIGSWMRCKMNLGTTLNVLGQREKSAPILTNAVAVLREVCKERKSSADQQDIASAQVNLGNALKSLGHLTSDPKILKEAIAVQTSALDAYPQDSHPLDRAKVNGNLATALLCLFDLILDTELLDDAFKHSSKAREFFQKAQASQFVMMADKQLAEINSRRT